jgi:hypothetical protein
MTKKDYILMAHEVNRTMVIINDSGMDKQDKLVARATLSQFVKCLSHALISDNPLFNYDKFEQACGL